MMPSGHRVQVHFYQNKVTGEVNYNTDFKIKGAVYPFPKNPGKEPTYLHINPNNLKKKVLI